MIHSKTGVESSDNSKQIAVAEHDIEDLGSHSNVHSSRAVGYSWKISSADDVPKLFGSGGWHDGATALIATYKNTQVEDSIALHGNGERVIDENIHSHNIANANTEFNFSQFKSGALTYADPEPRFNVTQTVSSGDIALKVDPYSSAFDETSQALGNIMNPKYKLNGKSEADQANDQRTGINPFFGSINAIPKQDKFEAQGIGNPEPTMEDEENISYYYNDGFFDDNAVESINRNMESGLRRVNIKTSQSTQLERVAQKEDIMKAIQDANDNYANILRDHFSDVYRSTEQADETRESLRQPSSKYYASQMGVNDVSRDSEKSYKRRKHKTPTKLNSMLISV